MKKIYFLILLLFSANAAHAALPVAVYEVRSSATAGNVNGGGFNSARGGTDYTLQDAAQVHSTDGVSTASTNFTSVTGGFTDAMKGNFLHLTAATGTPTVGWYEIVSVTDANTIVLDRVSGTYTLADFYIGGAMSLNSTLDDDFFEIVHAPDGSTVYIKSGSYTLGESMLTTGGGSSTAPVQVLGYNATRGDNPTGADRPTIDCTASFSIATGIGDYWIFKNLILTGGSSQVLWSDGIGGLGNIYENLKITNTSGTANRTALLGGGGGLVINCELVSTNGYGLRVDGTVRVIVNYIHDSVIGIYNASGGITGIFNIIESCSTAAIQLGSAENDHNFFYNTLYGAETPAGIGFHLPTTTSIRCRFVGNIIYGFTTGASGGSNTTSNFWDYNDFYNNTTDRTNVTAGDNDLAVDPQFTAAASGDFSIGTNLKAAGFPGAFQGGLSTGYLDVGAVQRQEASASTDLLGVIE